MEASPEANAIGRIGRGAQAATSASTDAITVQAAAWRILREREREPRDDIVFIDQRTIERT